MSPQSLSSPSPAQEARKLSRQALLLHTPFYQFSLLNVSQIQLLLSSCASAFSPGPLYLLPQSLEKPSNSSPCLQFHFLHLLRGYHRGCMTFQNCQSGHTTITTLPTLKFLNVSPRAEIRLFSRTLRAFN